MPVDDNVKIRLMGGVFAMRLVEVLSVAAFIFSAILVLGVSARRRRAEAKLAASRNHFIAQGLLSHGYLMVEGEEGVQKVERLLEDLDSEWHWRHESQLPPDRLEKLASYLGNVNIRSSRL
jgi:hypothetical protein